MNLIMLALALIGLLFVLFIGWLIYRRIPKKPKVEVYTHEWRELQSLLKDKTQWPEAVKRADALLDKALKCRKFKGKSMGERMVSAQRSFTNNDDVWFAHNFYKKSVVGSKKKLKEIDVKDALLGFRQGLMDLGALQTTKPAETESEEPK